MKNHENRNDGWSVVSKLLGCKFKETFLPWGTAALVALSSNWAADAIPATFEVWLSGQIGRFSFPRTLSVVLFVGSIIALYFQRNIFFKPRTRQLRNEPPEKRKHLVMFLSDLDSRLEYNNGIPEGLNLVFNFYDDLATLELHKEDNFFWRWEMGLRAICTHVGKLKTVTIACSTKSILEAHLFLEILQKYNELDGIIFHIMFKGGNVSSAEFLSEKDNKQYVGLDFESFDELSDAIWSFLKKNNYPEQDIMLDFTGGQKVTSVVTAAMTFNRKIKAQYIQTNAPWQAISYDAVHAIFDTGNLG